MLIPPPHRKLSSALSVARWGYLSVTSISKDCLQRSLEWLCALGLSPNTCLLTLTNKKKVAFVVSTKSMLPSFLIFHAESAVTDPRTHGMFAESGASLSFREDIWITLSVILFAFRSECPGKHRQPINNRERVCIFLLLGGWGADVEFYGRARLRFPCWYPAELDY